jgi:hypothetical protein
MTIRAAMGIVYDDGHSYGPVPYDDRSDTNYSASSPSIVRFPVV